MATVLLPLPDHDFDVTEVAVPWRLLTRVGHVVRFATEYGAKYPKAVTTLKKDVDFLLTFFDFPAEHWKDLRTSNVVESPFATVRLRQRGRRAPAHEPRGC